MTRSIQVFVVLIVHTLFCVAYLVFGIDSQEFAGHTIQFGFGKDEVIFILSLSSLTILTMFAAFFTPANVVFKSLRYKRKRLQTGIYLICGLIIFFILFQILKSNANYGILATEREKYSFIIEMRIIPYLLIIQYMSKNYTRSSHLFRYFLLFSIVVVVFYQARSILFEVVLIALCIKFRNQNDKFKLRYYLLIIVGIPVSNLAVAVRNNISIFEFPSELIKFEYLIIFNNLLAAVYEYEYTEKLSWLMERLVLIFPSPLRGIVGFENPSNQLFSDVSQKAELFAGGFSYIANGYIIFGYYFLFVFYLVYLVVEITRRNFMVYKVENYLASAYPILLSYVVLAIRNDMGVLLKQIVQLLLVAMLMNLVSRMIIND